MLTFADDSVSGFPNTQLGWGEAPNIAPRVPKAFAGSQKDLAISSPWKAHDVKDIKLNSQGKKVTALKSGSLQ